VEDNDVAREGPPSSCMKRAARSPEPTASLPLANGVALIPSHHVDVKSPLSPRPPLLSLARSVRQLGGPLSPGCATRASNAPRKRTTSARRNGLTWTGGR
jgi:hypothetical protein